VPVMLTNAKSSHQFDLVLRCGPPHMLLSEIVEGWSMAGPLERSRIFEVSCDSCPGPSLRWTAVMPKIVWRQSLMKYKGHWCAVTAVRHAECPSQHLVVFPAQGSKISSAAGY